MRKEEILEKKIKNGTYRHVVYRTNVDPLKAFKGHKIEKITSMVCRFGCFYGNVKKQVILDEELVNPIESTKKWGEWVENFVNVMSEKVKELETITYVWFYFSKNYKHRPQVKWYLDGVEVEKEYLIENGYVSAKNPKVKSNPINYDENPMFVKRIEDIIKF